MLRLLLSQLLGRRDWRDDVSAYLDDELTPRDRLRVEARLAQSEEMRTYLEDLREMRSVLRGFASQPARAPFQLTPEMINSNTATEIRPSGVERALRVSMTTAAIGVATFSAVLIFDAVDRPSVAFTPTSAGDASIPVPTAQIVTDQVVQQVSVADDAGPSSVTVVSIESAQQQQASVAAYRQEQSAAGDQELAHAQEQAEQQAQQRARQQAFQDQEVQQQYEEQDFQQAASDPSRRALNASRDGAEVDEEQVSAADVVSPKQEAPAESSSQAADEEVAGQQVQAADVASVAEQQDEQPVAHTEQTESQVETRTVATSVRQVETDWPLEQRPQTSSVRVATDPAWEAPVQIVLAIIAFGATFAWLFLTFMDRRRQT